MAREKSEFGAFLAAAIKDANLSQFDFYTAVGIARPYFYDILSGKASPPPYHVLSKMLLVLDEKLGEDAFRHNTFFDLAAKARHEIPADINELIETHPQNWDEIRKTLTSLLAAQG